MRNLRWLSLALLTFTSLASSIACYDSRWGERTRTQQHNAAHLAPAALSGSPLNSGAPAIAAKTFHLRAHATAQYSAQTVDWQHDLKEVVTRANAVVEPLGAHLELDAMTTFTPGVSADDMDGSLDALRKDDDGAGVDWVIGLVGGLPKFTPSFHDLGRGEVIGKYFVLRAASDLKEHDAIDTAFDELSAEDRLTLVHERRQHRAAAVFLHELGHTLGAVHETSPNDLMLPTYSKTMSGFGVAPSELLRAAIARRADPPSFAASQALAKDLLACYEGPLSKTWVEPERLAIVARLRSILPQPVAAPSTSSSTSTPSATTGSGPRPIEEVGPSLKEGDRPIYALAVEQFKAGQLPASWKTASPLFAAYPEVYGVQDLRCQIAMKQGVSWPVLKAECAALMKISTKK